MIFISSFVRLISFLCAFCCVFSSISCVAEVNNSDVKIARMIDEDQDDENDPFEPINRVIFNINYFFDDVFLEPLAIIYKETTPDIVQDGFHNFFSNLRAPLTFVASLFSGDVENAVTTIARFTINSTVGICGLCDPSTHLGIKSDERTFGNALASWGIGTGPYIMVPFIGPSNLRDTCCSFSVDYYGDPVVYAFKKKNRLYVQIVRKACDAFDYRVSVLNTTEQLKKSSMDLYATLRSLYWQKKRSAKHGNNDGPKPLSKEELDGIGK